jgi:phosphoglycolate phosphatase-like HAD superfamily hydrolase/tRNA(Arg) A34 adenosine deaminase TadA
MNLVTGPIGMNLRALLLDLDGTLFDTNELHIDAWAAAFASQGYRVGRGRIADVLGEGDHALITDVLGSDAERSDGAEIVHAKDAAFRRRLGRPVELMRGARELLDAIRDRQLRMCVVSGHSREVTRLLEHSAGLALARVADAVVTREQLVSDASEPHLLMSACDRLGEDPLACAFIGDAREDADAARLAGIAFVGITSGYTDRTAFARTGARHIASSAFELAADLETALTASSKIEVPLDAATISSMMAPALRTAQEALTLREAPVGAALFSKTGELLATGHNRACETRDRSLHAELDAFHTLTKQGHATEEAAILVSTLEPCVMCLGAAMEVGIDVVVFGLESPDDGGLERVRTPMSPENLLPRIRRGIRRTEARDLFVRWLQEVSTPAQRPFAESLLAQTKTQAEVTAEVSSTPGEPSPLTPLALGHRLPRSPRRRVIVNASHGEKGPL